MHSIEKRYNVRKILITIYILCVGISLFAQKATISGYVEDAETGEELIGANVYEGTKLVGVATNYYGFYSLTLPIGIVEVHYQYVGYPAKVITFNLQRDTVIKVALSPNVRIEEVLVEAKSIDIVKNSQMSITEVPLKQIKNLPVLLGETDVLKVVQLLPGVQSGSEGTSGLYVRGGGPDQNLFLLDGVPVYNASHLFGFFSIFNAEAIKNVTLYKGGFPARYGGRLSSVIDIRMKEGNSNEMKGEVSVGLISSKITLEGPLFSDKTTFIVSARRTYIDLLTNMILYANENTRGERFGYYFYDCNAKVTHTFSDKDKVFVSFYNGKDKMYEKSSYSSEGTVSYGGYGEIKTLNDYSYDDQFGWGNTIAAMRWNHVFSNKFFGNATATYSNYSYFIRTDQVNKESFLNNFGYIDSSNVYSNSDFYHSGIRDLAFRYDIDYMPGPRHSVKFGVSAISHLFDPGARTIKEVNTVQNVDSSGTVGNGNLSVNELNAYIEDDFKLFSRFKVNTGVHYSAFMVRDTNYHSLEPRFSIRYTLGKNASLKASYAAMTQYIHLLSTSKIEQPTDLWLPSTNNIKPQKSHQVAVGFAHAVSSKIDFSTELFYKKMNNLLEYKDGASYKTAQQWEDAVERGRGWSYGFEVLFQKSIGRTTGWIGYTWSRSDRLFANLSGGNVFPYKYDRRHDVSITVNRKIKENVDIGLTWVFGTGNAVSIPKQKYVSFYDVYANNGNEYYDDWYDLSLKDYSIRNNYRMPAYHRLDIGLNYHKDVKWGHRVWSVSVYNVYNRQNPYTVYFRMDDSNLFSSGDYSTDLALFQQSLFPLIPSVTWSLSFVAKKKNID